MFTVFAFSITFNSTTYAVESNFTPQIGEIENGKGRKIYAKKLYTFFSKIDEYIPSLSPSQRDWLEKEWKAYRKNQISQRYFEIINSKEYMIDCVRTAHTLILGKLALIVVAAEQKEELSLWTDITVYLIDTVYWQNLYRLTEKGLVDKKFFGLKELWGEDNFFVNNGVIPVEQILNHIVRPYFTGNLPN